MRRKLLTLGALAAVFAINAQTTYVGSDAKFFVSTGASVYSGGDWMLDSNKEKTVENKGDITIVGNYIKGTNNTDNEGKEFVNVYTGTKDYGQVKILSATVDATARMTVQRPAASSNYFGTTYETSYPYVDTVNYLMNSFSMSTSLFRGDCQLNTICANRYKMTLTKWDNNKLHHDAVLSTDTFKAGDIYNLNLVEANMRSAMTGIIPYKGTPSGKNYSRTAKGIINKTTEKQFTSAKYNTWKKLRNPYDEEYQSYLGYVDTEDRIYAKNTYRFGNPYTSNLDLSTFDGENAWLKILNNGGNHTIKTATGTLIKDFTIKKRTDSYDDDWGPLSGTITKVQSYYISKFDGTQWTGDAEALLIRPTETFQLYFPTLNPVALGGTRIVNIKVDFNDNHKTFDHVPSAKSTTSTGLVTMGTGFRSMSTLSKTANLRLDFHQLKLSLAKDNTLLGTSFLVGTNYNKESGETTPSEKPIFMYGVNTNEIAYDSKKEINEFNSLSYIGKPLGIGFNNLTHGETYQLAFNLYEGSIFNEVKKPSEFFLLDTKTEEVTRIDPSKTYGFVADEDIAKRFVVYWKQAPMSKKEEQKKAVEIKAPETIKPSNIANSSSQNTVIYEEIGKGKIRFENISNKADVQVYNVSGRLVYTTTDVPTNIDYTINVKAPGMYVVKVTYQNGEVRTLKFINK